MQAEAYETPVKRCHRAACCIMYLGAPRNFRKVLYVDTPEGDATRSFLREGIPPQHLEAVNFDGVPCTRIERQGVKVHYGDIHDVILQMHASNRKYACIWLDTTHSHIRRDAWQAAIHCAYYVFGAYCASRQAKGGVEKLMEEAKAAVLDAGGFCPEAPHVYDGKSGKPNMVRVVGTKYGHGNARTRMLPQVRRSARNLLDKVHRDLGSISGIGHAITRVRRLRHCMPPRTAATRGAVRAA